MKNLFLLLSLFALRLPAVQAQPTKTPVLEVAAFGRHQPIGVGVSKQGRIFVTFPKRKKTTISAWPRW
jgi:hypothetical protein